jgi:hypothetical protein
MAVPNTTTFDMSDVRTAVGNYDNLSDLFKFADSAQFDPLYAGNKDNLLNFRNYGNQIVWRAFNAYGPEKSFNSKSCGTKPNVTLYYFGSNSSCIQIGNTICNNSSGTSCRVSTGVYYTTYCFDQWIEVLYDSKQGAYTVVNLGYCSPP